MNDTLANEPQFQKTLHAPNDSPTVSKHRCRIWQATDRLNWGTLTRRFVWWPQLPAPVPQLSLTVIIHA